MDRDFLTPPNFIATKEHISKWALGICEFAVVLSLLRIYKCG